MLYLGKNLPRVRNLNEVAQELGSRAFPDFPNGIPREAVEAADEAVKVLTMRGHLSFAEILMGKLPTQNLAPLTVDRIVDKLAELSEEGAKAVCLTCEVNVDLKRKIFAHDHSNEISMVARTRYPFFGESLKSGCFTLGTRGYFWVPRHVIGESGNVFPGREQCVNFPISEV